MREMKWWALLVIAILLVALWPKTEAQKATPAANVAQSSQSSRANHSRRPNSQALGSRLAQATDGDLQSLIIERWPTISSDLPARDASVVEFIRILREMGGRDGPGALAFLDQLDQTNKEAAWLMARVAVAGGWSLSDPEAAALALLEEDNVLPVDSLSFISPKDQRSRDALDLAISQAAAQIFEAWVAQSPDQTEIVALDLLARGASWNFNILSQLTRLALPAQIESNRSSSEAVDRNSIDAILNNPNRTVSSTFIRLDKLPTDQMKSLGEPASTQAEWAARNPDHAIDLIQQSVNESETVEPQLIAGLGRINSNYQELLALAPLSQREEVTQLLVRIAGPNSDEIAWQLDGRETTWILSQDQRIKAMLGLIESGDYSPPEIPNQTKRPD